MERYFYDSFVLDLEMLKRLKPGSIISKGETIDSDQGVNISDSKELMRWIAKKGSEMQDWHILIHWANVPWKVVETQGIKVLDRENITKLVRCTDEALIMYNYSQT